ncbi:adventurous gliding motility protein AgmC [Melittangium boletus]|uniref:Bacterial Ig-like domain-containing protein n=1 Tax=Melittangium boletus DSM 14713 TaxID=1294270 RepID=A0A250I619_9BACT|nr:hypothetical protein [Melittangium boletus]ATB27299.1 hypothetical protein MEBOL_000737 [Melittangium boletus DSM 14713]
MKTPFMRKWLPTAVGLLALGPASARAAPDTFALGSGRDGALAVSTSGTVINAYAPLAVDVARKATSLLVGDCLGSPCFAAGDLVLVYQGTGLSTAPVSGDPAPLDLGTSQVGRWEFARLSEVTASTLRLTAPLVQDYPAEGTQVIRVPEYTTVSIAAGQSLVATPWNGSAGGVVAFLATGEVNNEGTISADGAGFRGGQYVADTSGARGCTELDEGAPQGAQKGEGLAGAGRYGATQSGRGNVANGAGGANCFRSGGGGGGNAGSGGQGGRSDTASDSGRDAGGLGGAAVSAPLLTHLLFGGGGGAGHGSSASGSGGGTGGGAVFLRASQLLGSGTLSASGGSVGTVTEGGSGGGAGGALYVRIVRSAGCGAASASGGIGSTSSSARVGPGGGGGSGQVLFQAAPGAGCTIIATGAASGGQLVPADGAYGAQAGQSSTPSQLNYGFIIPVPPTVVTPPDGTITNNVRPAITGTSTLYPQRTEPNTEVILYIDGEEVGRVMSDAAGDYAFDLPQDLAEGPHTVRAAAAVDAVQSLDSAPNNLIVDITPPETLVLSGPKGAVQERNPRFEFGSNEGEVTYTCSLDGEEFVPCPPSGVFEDLPDGPHTVRVRARDRAGNEDDSPASWSFTVAVADRALIGDGLGCSATGRNTSILWLSLGLLAVGLNRRRLGGP